MDYIDYIIYGQSDVGYLPSQSQPKIICPLKSQSKYLSSQTFDRGQRSEYRIYWSATPLICSNLLNPVINFHK